MLNSKILLILTIGIISTSSYSQRKQSDLEKACDNIDEVSNLMAPYLTQTWPGVATGPSGPVPVISTFIQSGRQPVADFCRFVKTVQSLDTLGGIHATSNYINELTDNQYKKDMDFTLETLDTGVALHNYTNGQSGRNAESIAIHRRLNRYMRSSDKYFSEKNGREAETFISKGEREAQARRMISSANKSAMISRAANCTSQSSGLSEDILSVYDNKISPYYDLEYEYEEEVYHHLRTLQDIGIKMVDSPSMLKEYQRELLGIYNNYIIYKKSKVKYKKETIKKNGKNVSSKRPYYKYSTKINNKEAAAFIKKYSKQWDNYVTLLLTQNPKLLTDRNSSIVRGFRTLSYECRKSKISKEVKSSNSNLSGLTFGDPSFDTKFKELTLSCREGVKLKKKYLNQIIIFYGNGLLKYLSSLKRTRTIIWNFESEHMKINRKLTSSTEKTPIGDITGTISKCSEGINYSGAELLKLKSAGEQVEARARFAEQVTVDTINYEKQFNKRVKERNEYRNRMKLGVEVDKRRDGPVYMEIPERTPNSF